MLDKWHLLVRCLRWSFIALFFLALCTPTPVTIRLSDLSQSFSGLYGQIEVGGAFAGLEFHHSRPLPSRISFYYPVANSIDLSTDYWRRDTSMPFRVVLNDGSNTDSLHLSPMPYDYTPFQAVFRSTEGDRIVSLSYDFCHSLPVMVWRFELTNTSVTEKNIELTTLLSTGLRTSHTYTPCTRTRTEWNDIASIARTMFDRVDTDSAVVFVANAGLIPIHSNRAAGSSEHLIENPDVEFQYQKVLKPGQSMRIVQLIGSCIQSESDSVIQQARDTWGDEMVQNRQSILNYVNTHGYLSTGDSILQETADWSRAMLLSNRHYLDGRFVPMPCPAEYNFFFTHDLLLTGLGAIHFDTEWVKGGYQFLLSLARPDSILPHAYYWKDDGYKTEFCGSDNWNHLWFILSAGSFLRHSGDLDMLDKLYPLLTKSLHMMLQNRGSDNVMYSSRPDWWDIGDVYGARVYLTSLMIRALREFAVIAHALDREQERIAGYLDLADSMQVALVQRFWDDEKHFLMNGLDQKMSDPHYYAGSLIAAHLQLLNRDKKEQLIQTAREKLLDEKLGITNAAPFDFHELISQYHFNGMEMGEPYYYFNGGIWPHGTAWYILGLLSIDETDQAKDELINYLTLSGIRSSPGGTPSFYEYRCSNPDSPDYGKIDKPTFLWAAGWYLYTLNHLCGVRENPWHLTLSPALPDDFNRLSFDVQVSGRSTRVVWKGRGRSLQHILVDNRPGYSAVLFKPCNSLVLQRGKPTAPYLADASCLIRDVRFSTKENMLTVDVAGISDQGIGLNVISPARLTKAAFNESPVVVDDQETDEFQDNVRDRQERSAICTCQKNEDFFTIHFKVRLKENEGQVRFWF